MSYRFLYPLLNLPYHSYSHYKNSDKAQFHIFAGFWQKIFWSGSLGSVSALSHEGTLKLLKQSFWTSQGGQSCPRLALCHSTCSPWHRRTSPRKWRHNEGTSAQLLTPGVRLRKKGGILMHF